MNDKERFLASLKLEEVDRVSAACPLQTATVEMMEASGASWPNAHRDPEKMATLALAANRLAGIESARVPFDLCVEAETVGSQVTEGRLDSQPSIRRAAFRKIEAFEDAVCPDPLADGRMATVVEAVRILAEEDETVPVIAGVVGPFTLAGQVRGVETLLMDFFDNPDFVKSLLKYSTEVLKAYGKALVENGADAVVIIDPSAGSELLGTSHYREMAFPYCKELVESLDAPSILHICGDSKPILEMMAETGVSGISLDHLVDVGEAREVLGDKTAIIGNINPADTLFLGTPEAVKEESLECIRKGANVLAPGCGIPTRASLENIKAMVEAARESANQ